MTAKIYLCTILALAIAATNSSPLTFNFKNGENLKYFWFRIDNGTVGPAFLEGGPPALTKANENDIKFFLYTKDNPNNPDQLILNCDSCLEASHFDRNAPVKILCHGFGSSHDSGFGASIKDAYMGHATKYNVININWSVLAASPWYDTAAANTKVTGQYLARFVEYLVAKGVTSLDRIHFIGHSLGSHVGGVAGFSSTIGKKARITALDPALPLFGDKHDNDRIDPSDAIFVDVIHTAGGTLLDGGLAFTDPRGDCDFYPNNGKPSQPGCGVDLVGSCSHGRSYEFFAESVRNQRNFNACKCTSWEEYSSGRCTCQVNALMGDATPSSTRGLLYLRTNANPPFGQA